MQTRSEESIDGAKSRAAVASSQQLHLMSEREILQDEILMGAECGPKGGDEGQAEPKHGGQCERTRTQRSTISADRDIGEGQAARQEIVADEKVY
jgi:hypothetical protein